MECIDRLAQRAVFEPQAAISTDHKDKDLVQHPTFLNFPSNQGFGIAYDESKQLDMATNQNRQIIKATQPTLQDPIYLKVNFNGITAN